MTILTNSKGEQLFFVKTHLVACATKDSRTVEIFGKFYYVNCEDIETFIKSKLKEAFAEVIGEIITF